MQWGEDDLYKPYPVSQKELDGIYDRAIKAFNEACDEIDRQQDDITIRRLLYDKLGPRTFMIEVARG